MATKEYSFYPGCSSQHGATASNYLISVDTMCQDLDIKLNTIPDWNCCSASIGFASGGELPRLALSARNIALSQKHNPGQAVVATCAACWLSTRETKERLQQDNALLVETNLVLKEANLQLEAEQPPIKHMVEVLIEDFGFDKMAEKVVKPLEGLKIAGYVGCQTNRPFGIEGESMENPKYLDKFIETMGAEAVNNYEKKVSCCGGALTFSEPDKTFPLVKDILESALDAGADMIATPCPVCQMNVEVYQKQINKKFNTNINIPVVYYSTLMNVAYGHNARESALNGLIVKADKLKKIADR